MENNIHGQSHEGLCSNRWKKKVTSDMGVVRCMGPPLMNWTWQQYGTAQNSP